MYFSYAKDLFAKNFQDLLPLYFRRIGASLGVEIVYY